ncbi:MAG: amidohydrolase family protein [bacterium]|nr:amidohydrolase family protein [bacterium]
MTDHARKTLLSGISKLYDGSSDQPKAVQENVDLWLAGERIEAVRPHDPAATNRTDLTVVEAAGWTVTPGLVDCHGHVTILGLSKESIDTANSPSAFVYVEKVLHASLVDGGVTTMRDIGGATHAMKRLVEDGVAIGPRLRIAICMLSTTGGHADFRGPDRCHAAVSKLWGPAPGRPSSIVDGPWEARKRVREIAACGADLIKLCTSPGVASPGDKLENRDFTEDEIRAISDEAAGRGLRVAAHAHSKSGIELAVRNGVHDIQHISFMDEAAVEEAHRKGCTVTPTSWVVNVLPDAPGLSDFVRDKAKRAAEAHSAAVDFARRGGLKILAGTDPVLPGMHGRNFMELVYLMKDGLPALQAWHGMTGLAAQELGADDTGVLAPGKRADLLVATDDVVAKPELLETALLEVVQDGKGHRGGVAGLPQRTVTDTVAAALAQGT